MGPEAWKKQIGEQAWNHIRPANPTVDDLALAFLLNRALDVGFMAPAKAPQVDPKGTRVLWPAADDRAVAVLTAEGLSRLYARRGHGFFLLRCKQLVSACAGGLLPRLQEILGAYEEQCAIDNVEPLAFDWHAFVGGSRAYPAVQRDLPVLITHECPAREASQMAQADGPGK